ncbi:MAG: uracil-DNA glycosylase [Pyramidobacter sp.]|nr:uracil-DNA glycosylase [Pyramidobacter sp.]
MIEMLSTAARDDESRRALYEKLCAQMKTCRRCGLCEARRNAVPGEGSLTAGIVFVGEGPGADEDEQGRPFVGASGQLLTRILEAAKFRREEVYITNVVKCRPPMNRTPRIEEVLTCQCYLEAQLALLKPKIIVCLGNTPLKWFLHGADGIMKMRGRWFKWRGAALMPMFHPSFLLRNESKARGGPKDLTWQDIQEVRKRYEHLKG